MPCVTYFGVARAMRASHVCAPRRRNRHLYVCIVRQISGLAPDTVECCSLARKLALRLTDGLSNHRLPVIDEAEEGGEHTAAEGGADEDDVWIAVVW